MRACPHCGELIGSNASTCFRCGAYVPTPPTPQEDPVAALQKRLRRVNAQKYLFLVVALGSFLIFGAFTSHIADFLCAAFFLLGIVMAVLCIQRFRLAWRLADEVVLARIHHTSTPPRGTPEDPQTIARVQPTPNPTFVSRTSFQQSPIQTPSAATYTSSSKHSSILLPKLIPDCSIHPDILDLLYTTADDCPFQEPSRISPHAPIAKSDADAERLPYYPSYEKMTPAQRRRYIRFLANPYDSSFEIGYVFVLYYGLERRLLERDQVSRVMEVIQKLFLAHDHKSFRGYAADTLIYIGAKCGLLSSIHVPVHEYADALPIVYLQAKCNGQLTSSSIFLYAQLWGFSNQRYIKAYPDLFRRELDSVLCARYSLPAIPVKAFDDAVLPKGLFPAYANYSIPAREFELPNLFEYSPVSSLCLQALTEAHESVKKILSAQRKAERQAQKEGQLPPSS